MDNINFEHKLSALVDSWCDKRNFNCLRVILPVYPFMNGLTDDYELLLSCLKDIRSNYSDSLSKDDDSQILEVIEYIYYILRNR